MKTEKDFPNGFTSWIETHHLIVAEISQMLIGTEDNLPMRVMCNNGIGGIFELAEDLTNKFEEASKDKEWDGEYFESIAGFCEQELNKED